MSERITDIEVDIRPLFVLGAPRSGTTFLNQILNTHPKIFLTDELRWVSWLLQESRKLREGSPVHGNPYPWNYGPEFANYLLGNAGRLVAPFYKRQAERAGKTDIDYWGDKFPHYNEALPKMPKMFPRARYVMIHRDLRDVVCSVMNGHGWDVEKSATYITSIYADYVSSLTKLTDSGAISRESIWHVSYSVLSYETAETTSDIFNWLSLDISEEVATTVTTLSGIQSHSIRKSDGNPTAFRPERSIGRWQRDLDAGQIAVVEETMIGIQDEIDKGRSLVENSPGTQVDSLTKSEAYQENLHGGEGDTDNVVNFALLFHPRSGSSWLRSVLIGNPGIMMAAEPLAKLDTASAQDSYLRDFFGRSHGSNLRAIGLKMAVYQMRDPEAIKGLLEEIDVRVIVLTRDDILRTALSQLRRAQLAEASEKELGRRMQNLRKDIDLDLPPMIVDPSELFNQLRRCAVAHRDTQDLGESFTLPRLELTYEQLIEDFNGSLNQIERFLGVPVKRREGQTQKVSPGDLTELIDNWSEVERALKQSEFAWTLERGAQNVK